MEYESQALIFVIAVLGIIVGKWLTAPTLDFHR
jgi:hypothetical protein